MKGISHFISGVAAASCFPWTVAAALERDPTYFIIGAVYGILPDTIDFKFYRFFYRYHQTITPDPRNPDPQAIANEIAHAIETAAEHNGLYRLKINTLRRSADQWQQFKIRLDPHEQAVEVEMGPVVTTGQVPIPGTFPEKGASNGWKKITVPIEENYEAVTTVDIFDGPAYGFETDAQGRVAVHFLPWHRTWTHSLVLGAVFSVPVGLWLDWRAGLVAYTAYVVHILEDQLGYMGSSLFAPFSNKRVKGLELMHAGDALPNFGTVWFCCMLIFWNCYRAIPDPIYHFGFIRLMLYGLVIPLGLYGLLYRMLNRKTPLPETIDTANEWGEGNKL